MKYNWGPSIIIDPLDIFHKTKLYQKIFFMSEMIGEGQAVENARFGCRIHY